MRYWKRTLLVIVVLAAVGYGYWRLVIPVHRVEVQSELVMLGDLDHDNKWTARDIERLDAFVANPFSTPGETVSRIDLNQSGTIEEEDAFILRALVASAGDPYAAEEASTGQGRTFPRPRELYRYITVSEYRPRPLYALPYPLEESSTISWLRGIRSSDHLTPYAEALNNAIYDEAVRFDCAWRKRRPGLLPIESRYAQQKLAAARELYEEGQRYELLLAMTDLVEDAETLTARNQPDISLQLLVFRDHLRDVLNSPLYADFRAGKQDWRAVLKAVSGHLRRDVGLEYDLETVPAARNLGSIQNYVQRAEWQYYKSTTREQDFRALIKYAQHDPRYLRAVARTNRRFGDLEVSNHNLPMLLLFREALRITNGDKKRAVGLLDEAIRIPYAWIKSLPREALPGSLAMDNFLLPGNKEDGADKSRHWNVFGGICLYKSPQEALDLALKREMQDLREHGHNEEAMREFLRDMIANLNGMYQVLTVNPDLLGTEQPPARQD